MLHSSWDMETYAQTLQNERMREAARARQLEAAGLGWRIVPSVLAQRLARALSSAQARFSGLRRASATEPAAAAQASVHLTPVAATLEDRPAPRVPPVRAAEPYSAMVVVARPAAAPVSERS